MGWSQIYLELNLASGGSVDGESETAGYEKQIVLLDVDWGMSVKKDTTKGTGANREVKRSVDMESITLTKRFDISSTKLYAAMASRDRVTKGRVSVPVGFALEGAKNKTKRDTFAIEFGDAYIEKIGLDMVEDGKSMVLQEKIEIRYGKIKIEVTPVAPDGSYEKSPFTFSPAISGVTTV